MSAQKITALQWVKRVFPAKLGRYRKGKMVVAKVVPKEEAEAAVRWQEESLFVKKVDRNDTLLIDLSIDDQKFAEGADRAFLIEADQWKKIRHRNVWSANLPRNKEGPYGE